MHLPEKWTTHASVRRVAQVRGRAIADGRLVVTRPPTSRYTGDGPAEVTTAAATRKVSVVL
jgi:hypothetical protein